MAIAYIQPGQRFNIEGVTYEIEREVADKEWQSACLATGRYVVHTESQLLDHLVDRRLKFILPGRSQANQLSKHATDQYAAFDLLDENKQELAKVRYAYVIAVLRANLPKYTKESLVPVINETSERLNIPGAKPHWSTVNRWRKRFVENGRDIRALVDRDDQKGRREARYDELLYVLIDQAISAIYLTLERGTVQDTIDHAISLVAKENRFRIENDKLPIPTQSLVKNRISAIPSFERSLARYGYQVTTVNFRAALNEMSVVNPLERAEIDHTQFNIMVVDDNTMLPLGRPYFTACIDVATRCFLGIYVGFQPPSFQSVSQCLRNAILPKTDLREKYPSVVGEWEAFGVMEVLALDNGLEFHSHALEAVSHPFGITLLYTPRKKPWFKPYIERAVGTANRGVSHGKPGTVFEGILEKKDYDAAKKAIIKLSSFIEIANVWIVDYYHNRPHKGLGHRKPIDLWREKSSKIPIPLPADVSDLDSLFGSTTERVVTHKGVEINSLFYNSEALTDLRLRVGTKFKTTIRYNDADLGYIHVIEPDTLQPLRIPAIRLDYADKLSIYQHKICKKYAEKRLNREDVEALAEAKETIRQIIARDMSDKRIKTRTRSHRFLEGSQNVPPPAPYANAPTPSIDHAPSSVGNNLSSGMRDAIMGYRQDFATDGARDGDSSVAKRELKTLID